MKTYLKIIFCIYLIINSLHTLAQVRFGIKAGMNLGNMTDNQSSTGVRLGFQVGGFAELRLGDAFVLQPNLQLTNQGYKYVSVTEDRSLPRVAVNTSKGTKNLTYLQLPVYVVFKKDLGIGKLMVGAGPYVGYCFLATNNATDTYVLGSNYDLSITSVSGNYKMKFSGSDQELNPLDYGATTMIGLELDEKYQINFSYQYGLANIGALANQTLKNRTVGITLSYMFGY